MIQDDISTARGILATLGISALMWVGILLIVWSVA